MEKVKMLDYGFYCMDCLDGMKQFPDGYFNLAIVDPIYGDITGGGYVTGKYNGKRMSSGGMADQRTYHTSIWSQQKTGDDYFKELFRVSKNQIIWGGNYFVKEIQRDSQCWIVWDKRNDQTKYADCELAYTSFNRATRIFRFMWNGMLQEDMKHKEERIHPVQKPLALYLWILNNFAEPDDIILDTHTGSANSLIACRETGHKYVGFEIDPVYYELAKKRLDAAENQMNIFDFME